MLPKLALKLRHSSCLSLLEYQNYSCEFPLCSTKMNVSYRYLNKQSKRPQDLFILWMFCFHVYLCHVCALCPQVRWRLRDPLELELRMIVSHQVAAGNWPSARTSALDYWAICSASKDTFYLCFKIHFLYVWVLYLHIFLCTTHVPGTCGGQEEGIRSCGTGVNGWLWVIMWVLGIDCKSNKYSKLLSSKLSSPYLCFVLKRGNCKTLKEHSNWPVFELSWTYIEETSLC